jgi:hypothetical protein
MVDPTIWLVLDPGGINFTLAETVMLPVLMLVNIYEIILLS